MILQRSTHLFGKIKELISIAAIASRNPGDREALRNHVRRGIGLGLTKDGIMGALEVVSLPAGVLAMIYGIEVLMEIIGS